MKGCRPLSSAEVPMVIEAIQGCHALRDRALMVLALKTGLRISELLSLKIQSVWRQGRLRDRVYIERKYTKRRSEGKILPIHAQAKAALEAWLQMYIQAKADFSPGLPLFPKCTSSDQPLSRMGAWRVFQRAFEGAGIMGPGLGCHVTRKTFAATMWELLDHDLIRVQAALCHKSVSSTVSYIGVNADEIEAAILQG